MTLEKKLKEEGRKEGRKEEKKEIAKKMKKDGVTIDLIMKYTVYIKVFVNF